MAGPAISGRLALPGVPGAALEGTAHGVLGAMPGEALGGRQWPRIQGDGTVARIRSPTAKTRRRFGRYARRLRRSAQEGTHENRPHLPFHRARGMRDIRSAKVPVAMRLRTALDRLARRLLSPPPRSREECSTEPSPLPGTIPAGCAPMFKCPLDLWVYQEIVTEARPDLIIESDTATSRRGSTWSSRTRT